MTGIILECVYSFCSPALSTRVFSTAAKELSAPKARPKRVILEIFAQKGNKDGIQSWEGVPKEKGWVGAPSAISERPGWHTKMVLLRRSGQVSRRACWSRSSAPGTFFLQGWISQFADLSDESWAFLAATAALSHSTGVGGRASFLICLCLKKPAKKATSNAKSLFICCLLQSKGH